jgi:hypothetical protein
VTVSGLRRQKRLGERGVEFALSRRRRTHSQRRCEGSTERMAQFVTNRCHTPYRGRTLYVYPNSKVGVRRGYSSKGEVLQPMVPD